MSDPSYQLHHLCIYETRPNALETVRPVGHVGLQCLGAVQLCRDLDGQAAWYREVLGQSIVHDARSGNDGLVYLADHTPTTNGRA